MPTATAKSACWISPAMRHCSTTCRKKPKKVRTRLSSTVRPTSENSRVCHEVKNQSDPLGGPAENADGRLCARVGRNRFAADRGAPLRFVDQCFGLALGFD